MHFEWWNSGGVLRGKGVGPGLVGSTRHKCGPCAAHHNSLYLPTTQ